MNNQTQKAITYLIAKDHIKPKSNIAQIASKMVMNDLKGLMGDNVSFSEVKVEKWHIHSLLGDLAFLLSQELIEKHHVKKILEDAWNTEPYAWDICWYLLDNKTLENVESSSLDELILKLLNENPKTKKDILDGKTKACGSLMGPIMKETKGQANPKNVINRIIELVKDKPPRFPKSITNGRLVKVVEVAEGKKIIYDDDFNETED